MKWPPINGVLVSFRRPSQSNNPRLKWEYPCFLCGEWFPRKEVQVDHTDEPLMLEHVHLRDPNDENTVEFGILQ